MTKAEIVEKMAQDVGITKTDAQTCLVSFIANVTKALKKKDCIIKHNNRIKKSFALYVNQTPFPDYRLPLVSLSN